MASSTVMPPSSGGGSGSPSEPNVGGAVAARLAGCEIKVSIDAMGLEFKGLKSWTGARLTEGPARPESGALDGV